MTITATITRRIPITQLRPGALIDGHTVDSIEIAADGAAAWCWPPGRSSGRRVRIPLGALDGEVTVSAIDDEVHAVVTELRNCLGDDMDVHQLSAIFAVELASGWTFALHGDEPENADDRAAMLADIDATDEED